jgi:hypothetical protein
MIIQTVGMRYRDDGRSKDRCHAGEVQEAPIALGCLVERLVETGKVGVSDEVAQSDEEPDIVRGDIGRRGTG